MGKILKALKTANGDIPSLVMQCLEEPPEMPTAEEWPAARKRVSMADVFEPAFDNTTVLPLPGLAAEQSENWVSLRISDSSPLLSAGKEDRRAAEQYRIIRTRIFHQRPHSSLTVISSPGPGDGKTVTAVNLAAALALKSEDRVLLIDADLRLSKVHECLGIPDSPGLAEVLSGECELEQALVRVRQLPNFHILPAGRAETNPSELFDSSNWRALMSRLREEFQRTIVDCPPVEVVADYDLIADGCDGLVLVVRPDHTSRSALSGAMAKTKGKLIGMLINGGEDWFLARRPSPSYYYYQRGARQVSEPKVDQ